jgi:hypothetical protein
LEKEEEFRLENLQYHNGKGIKKGCHDNPPCGVVAVGLEIKKKDTEVNQNKETDEGKKNTIIPKSFPILA